MERYSDTAIEIINDLHTERMDYQSEYLPLIDAANQLAAYESTGIEPERVAEIVSIIGNDYDLGRLRELVEADKDERCAVFPFKPGENVYFIPDEVASLLLNKSLMEGRIHHISAFANGEIRISVEWNTAYGDVWKNIIFTVPPQNVRRIYEASEETLKKMDGQL